jgi:tRNA-dihydrouridine synthase
MEKFLYMLAPLEDMTNDSFRTLCYRHGADVTFTEKVSFESLAKNNKVSWRRIEVMDKTPTVIQVIGHREMFLKKFLSKFEPVDGFMGFNLNLGCPAPNFVNHGMGCAMVKRISKTRKLIDIIKSRGFKASVKMRLGANQYEKDKKAYLNLIKNVDADFFVVHARHGKQNYNDKADWNVFNECCETGKMIIANGDIKTKEDVSLLKSYGVNGVMIGREAIKNPGIFDILKGKPALPISEIKKEYLEISKRDEVFRYRKNALKHLGMDEGFREI